MNHWSPASLSPSDLSPVALFKTWLAEAEKTEPGDPTAVCLATVDETGMPNARMVLIRIIDKSGFAFFTNYNSRKGQELLALPRAALCFHWKSLGRQVRVQGRVEKTSEEEADIYYASRARESRIGAWASLQSSPLPDRDILLNRYREFEEKFKEAENPPRPPHWSGFRVVPDRIEFWENGDHRLHNRRVFEKAPNGWTSTLLYP